MGFESIRSTREACQRDHKGRGERSPSEGGTVYLLGLLLCRRRVVFMLIRTMMTDSRFRKTPRKRLSRVTRAIDCGSE